MTRLDLFWTMTLVGLERSWSLMLNWHVTWLVEQQDVATIVVVAIVAVFVVVMRGERMMMQ